MVRARSIAWGLRGGVAGFLLAYGSLGIKDSFGVSTHDLVFYSVMTGFVLIGEIVFLREEYLKAMRGEG